MEIKLNVGCGWRDFGSDWVHIDGGEYLHLNSSDIINLPYDDDSVDLLYSSHTFEYFDRIEALDVLYEWKRVLKKGGKIQLAVPDFEKIVKMYQDGYPLDAFDGMLFGRMFMGSEKIYHKTTYDFNSLKAILTSIGFKNVKVFKSDYADYSQAERPRMNGKKVLMSLNVEATK